MKIIKEAVDALYSMKEYATRNGFWDFRGVKADLSYEDFWDLKGYIEKRYPKEWNPKRTAFVFDSQVNVGLSRIYRSMTEHLGTDLEIFSDAAKAESWLSRL